MSDGLPTDDQVDRIVRGVQTRIRRRRSIRQGITGGAAAVLLLGGGIALLPHLGMSSASSGGGSAAGTSGRGADTAAVIVECHDSTAADSALHRVTANGPLPAAALAACGYGLTELQSGSGALTGGKASGMPSDQAAPQAAPATTAPPGILCRSKGGALHVYPGADPGVCAHEGLLPF